MNDKILKKEIDKLNTIIKRYKVATTIVVILSSIIFLIMIYFMYQNKSFSYVLNGESENFIYTNALFMKNKQVYTLTYGSVDILNKDIKLKDVRLMSNDRLIVASNKFLDGYSTEKKGYNEYFPKEVVDNIDNWYFEITYILDDEEKVETLNLSKREF